MKCISLLMVIVQILVLTGCSNTAGQPISGAVSSEVRIESSIAESSASSRFEASRPERSLPEVPEDPYAFMENSEFLEKAYAMGYAEDFLENESPRSEDEWLNPKAVHVFDVSPDKKWMIFIDKNAGPLFIRNLETGGNRVIIQKQGFINSYPYFASNELIGNFLYFGGGELYDLQGNVTQSFEFDWEPLGFTIFMPIYDPETKLIFGLGADNEFIEQFHPSDAHESLDRALEWMVWAPGSGQLIYRGESLYTMNAPWPEQTHLKDGYIWLHNAMKGSTTAPYELIYIGAEEFEAGRGFDQWEYRDLPQ